jgi:hypothetical protein
MALVVVMGYQVVVIIIMEAVDLANPESCRAVIVDVNAIAVQLLCGCPSALKVDNRRM